jgi:hypothetical protein
MLSMLFLHLHIDFLPMLFLDGDRVDILQVVMMRLTAPYLSCELVGNASVQQPACYCMQVCLSQGILALSYSLHRIC